MHPFNHPAGEASQWQPPFRKPTPPSSTSSNLLLFLLLLSLYHLSLSPKRFYHLFSLTRACLSDLAPLSLFLSLSLALALSVSFRLSCPVSRCLSHPLSFTPTAGTLSLRYSSRPDHPRPSNQPTHPPTYNSYVPSDPRAISKIIPYILELGALSSIEDRSEARSRTSSTKAERGTREPRDGRRGAGIRGRLKRG